MTVERVKHFETQAQLLRAKVGMGDFAPINSIEFAARLNAVVIYPSGITGINDEFLAEMEQIDAKSWSGGAHYLPDGSLQIVLNPNQTPERQNVTILEELAHCHYGHQMTVIGSDRHRDYDPIQEQEAYQTAAAILVPSKIVAMAIYKRESIRALGLKYGASQELLEMRIKVLGCWKDYSNAA